MIGPNADVVFCALGGGSAEVTPPYVVTPLDGLRSVLGPGVEIIHEVGVVPSAPFLRIDPRRLDGPGFTVELTGGSMPVQESTRSAFRWGTDVPAARISATYRPPASGEYEFELRGRGRMRLSVDGVVVCDGWERGERPPTGIVTLTEGGAHALLVEFEAPDEPVWFTGLRVGVRPPWPEEPLAAAVEAAAKADVAIVVVGLNSELESEGFDRADMNLPPGQDQLIAAVAAANPWTVVVLNAGSPVTMPWADDVSAIVQLWYPGQEGGHALADVLTGAADPGGRLPTTFPMKLDDSPAALTYPGRDGGLAYEEGVFSGYRGYEAKRVTPQFAFGHGLSYASYDYGEPAALLDDDGLHLSVDVTNTSARAGTEVVQVYVRDVAASVPRPHKELQGFAKVQLGAGETRTVRITLSPLALFFWDTKAGAWKAEPGEYELLVGRSSADIRGRVTVEPH